MNRLAFETATDFCSVALATESGVIVRERHAPREHAELVIPWARELLAEAGIGWRDLDSLAVSRGPGGFTSLRIGLSVAQGVALAHDLPVHAVSTLEALAQTVDPDFTLPRLLTVIDARMGEIYSAWFAVADRSRERIGRERVHPPRTLEVPASGPWMAAGSGLAAYGEEIAAALGEELGEIRPDAWPSAAAVLALAEGTAPRSAWELEPRYVRDDVTG